VEPDHALGRDMLREQLCGVTRAAAQIERELSARICQPRQQSCGPRLEDASQKPQTGRGQIRIAECVVLFFDHAFSAVRAKRRSTRTGARAGRLASLF
jgi:hypothetical protein